MKTFKYYDCNNSNPFILPQFKAAALVFETEAENVVKADALFAVAIGAEHSNSHVRVMVTVDPVKYATEQKFLEVAASEERLEQGFNFVIHNFGSASEKNTGDFLRWLFNDVVKEMTEEMKLAGIEEKNLGKMLAQKARPWYFARLNKV